jgi:membrane-associated phospholipid phosphatase
VTRIAAGCAFAALIVWVAAFGVEPLQDLDGRALTFANDTFINTPVENILEVVVILGHPLVYALICAGIVGLGLRRGVAEGVAVAVLIAGANVTTQVLKELLADPRPHELGVAAESWPSGHTTAAAVATLALLLVVRPQTRRRAAVIGGALTLAIASAVVIETWHYPSDVLGGLCVAGCWAAAVAALLSRRAATTAPRRRWRRATG